MYNFKIFNQLFLWPRLKKFVVKYIFEEKGKTKKIMWHAERQKMLKWKVQMYDSHNMNYWTSLALKILRPVVQQWCHNEWSIYQPHFKLRNNLSSNLHFIASHII